MSPSVKAMLGYEPDELLGTSARGLLHPARCTPVPVHPGEHRVEQRIRHRDGSWRTVESIIYQPVDSEVGGRVVVSRDIGPRKRRARRESLLHDVSANVAAAPDLDGALRAFSKALSGIAPHDRGGFAALDSMGLRVVAVTDHDRIAMPVGSVIDVDDPRVAALSGSHSPIVTSRYPAVAPLFDPPGADDEKGAVPGPALLAIPITAAGRAIGFISLTGEAADSFEDVDLELVQEAADEAAGPLATLLALEGERELSERLRQVDRMKDDFLAMVAHDLRTPLTVIAGFAETLRASSGRLDEATREQMVDGIVRRSGDLMDLVRQVLEVEALEARTVVLDQASTDATLLVKEAVEDIAVVYPAREIRMNISPSLPAVNVDRARIGEVLSNILINAAKFSPPGGPITVKVRRCDDGVMVAVHDEGPGIAPDMLPRVFERFSRSPEGASAVGFGLGLAISRKLVEAHGRSIGVESTKGEGTTFWFTLPCVDVDPAPAV
jgi:signal transduction histidine kinase